MMNRQKTIALVAHDNMKRDLAEWVAWNWEKLVRHKLVCTGTTGKMVARTLLARQGKTPENISRRCQRGELPAFKDGRMWRFEKEAFLSYIHQHSVIRLEAAR